MSKKLFKKKQPINIENYSCISLIFSSVDQENNIQHQVKKWILMNDENKKYKIFNTQNEVVQHFRHLKIYAKMKVQSTNSDEFVKTVYTILEIERKNNKDNELEFKDEFVEGIDFVDEFSKYDIIEEYKPINFKKIQKVVETTKETLEFSKNSNLLVEDNQNNIKRYDFVILGGGQTGLTLAKNLIQKHVSVLLIDRKNIGIKTSLDVKNFGKIIKHQVKKGINSESIIANLSPKLQYLNDEQNKAILKEIENNDFFEYKIGEVDELNIDHLVINEEIIRFKKLVFATGSRYDEIDYQKYPNIKKEMYLNLNELSNIDRMYSKVAIYGTGIDALELADAFCFLGVEVYIFDENVNPFNNFDDDFEAILKSEFHPEKMNWMLETKVEYHTHLQNNMIKINYNKAGTQGFIEVDKIFITDNKVSNTTNLDNKFNIPLNKKGSIIIDSSFRVKNHPNFFAIGDANGLNMISSQGNYQAISLVETLISFAHHNKYDSFNKTFTIDITPQFAFHGMNKNELDYVNQKYNEFIFEFEYELNSKLNAHKSKLKLYTNNKHEILGVFLYGHKIKELLPIFVLITKYKIKFNKLANLNFAFYSKSEALRDAAIQYEMEFVGLSNKVKKLNKLKIEKMRFFARKNKK